MIAFLTQYYRGLGHSNRIKLIAEKTGADAPVVVIDQLFNPPLNYQVPQEAILKDFKVSDQKNIFQFLMSDNLINFRIKRFKDLLDKYEVTVLVCEGFPFCRHQFAHEYFKYLEECKKRGIKIIFSVRDFPWDEPHDKPLQDWVNYTQNLICRFYAEKILVHGDENIMPLYSDRTNHSSTNDIMNQIKDLIVYTGYVCDDNQKPHERKNNKIFVSTGLNKEEGMLLFKQITKIAHKFPDYEFVMPIANKYLKSMNKKKQNMLFVDYIPNLNKLLPSCAAFITYGGYNSTMEILKSGIPSIIVPRQDGQKLEQFVRCYKFEPYGFFKVLNNKEFNKLEDTLKEVLANKPNPFTFSLEGAENSKNEIIKTYSR
jgi:predicted glycosyltransferase